MNRRVLAVASAAVLAASTLTGCEPAPDPCADTAQSLNKGGGGGGRGGGGGGSRGSTGGGAKTRTLLTGEPVTIPDDLIASLVDALRAAGYHLPGGTIAVNLLDRAPTTPDGGPR